MTNFVLDRYNIFMGNKCKILSFQIIFNTFINTSYYHYFLTFNFLCSLLNAFLIKKDIFYWKVLINFLLNLNIIITDSIFGMALNFGPLFDIEYL